LGEAHAPETHILPSILKAIAVERKEFEVFGSDYPTRDGTCVRDYIHVRDLASAHKLGLEWLDAGTGGERFQFGQWPGFFQPGSNRDVRGSDRHQATSEDSAHLGGYQA
jgi:UDP-glucose 4-epimerase